MSPPHGSLNLNGSRSRAPLKIAFTYDSQAHWQEEEGFTEEQCLEFLAEETVEAIAAALRKLGTVEMIGGIKALAKRLSSSKVDWDLVFNLSEGYGTIGREAQVPALLEAWNIPFTFSDSATMALCLDKAKTKMVLDHYKIPNAPFVTIPPRVSWPNSEIDLVDVIANSTHGESLKTFPLFVKPSSVSTGIGISQANKVSNHEELVEAVKTLSNQYPQVALLIERFLPGREFTVGILGTGADARVLGIREIVFVKNGGFPTGSGYVYRENDPSFGLDVYGHSVKMETPERYAVCPNPWKKKIGLDDPVGKAVAEVALDSWRVLGCRDTGRVDIRCDSKDPAYAVPNFIEVNPIAGMIPKFSDLVGLSMENGIDYEELITLIVDVALKRYH